MMTTTAKNTDKYTKKVWFSSSWWKKWCFNRISIEFDLFFGHLFHSFWLLIAWLSFHFFWLSVYFISFQFYSSLKKWRKFFLRNWCARFIFIICLLLFFFENRLMLTSYLSIHFINLSFCFIHSFLSLSLSNYRLYRSVVIIIFFWWWW